ncbi:MAG: hypothetical protein V3S64_17540 [bacterium]
MKLYHLWIALLLTLALSLPAGFALGQSLGADIEAAKKILADKPDFPNRMRLATLQFNEGFRLLQENKPAEAARMMQASVWSYEDAGDDLSEDSEILENARYGLAYAMKESNNPVEAIIVLEKIIAANPIMDQAMFLLGKILTGNPGKKSPMKLLADKNFKKGVKVLAGLSEDGSPPYDGKASSVLGNLGAEQYNEGNRLLGENDAAGAARMMQAAVWTLEDANGSSKESASKIDAARYGLAHALKESGNPMEAVLVMEKMIQVNPKNDQAKYLLGVTLMNSPGDKNLNKGVKVLSMLSKEGQSPYNDMAARAVTRQLYNLSSVMHAAGKKDRAADLLAKIGESVGAGKGASKEENNNVRFATGMHMLESDDNYGALEQLEAIKESDPNFTSPGGRKIDEVLSRTYYRAGRDQLEAGGETAGELALEMFTKAGETGDANSAGIRHGKAAAYALTGNEEGFKKESEALQNENPEYFKEISIEVEVKLEEVKEEEDSGN